MSKHRVIIDCDPGVDDAFALALALSAPEQIEVLGLTCVAGNVSLAATERNARRLCELLGSRVPVFAGCARPILRPEGEFADVHGTDGLGDIGLPEPTLPLQSQHAVSFMIETVMTAPEKTVTLCCIGPMTNLALAIVMEPRLAPRLRELVFMGGAAFRMARYRTAEFNFWTDPQAAHIVLSAGIPQTMLGLDATYQAHVGDEVFAAMDGLTSKAGRALAAMLRLYAGRDPKLHDICATAFLLAPDLFDGVDVHLAVEHQSELTRGQCVARATPMQLEGYRTNTRVITEVDSAGLFRLMLDRFARL